MPVAKETSSFEKAPIGNHQAVCVFVHDIGAQESEYMGNPVVNEKVILTWEIAELQTEGKDKGKPFLVSGWYTLSLNEKANLRKVLESWRGRTFTKEELAGFELNKLIGANCLLNVTETDKGGRKVSAISPLPKNFSKLVPVNTSVPENFAKFIERERAKGVNVGNQEYTQPPHQVDKEDDALPF